ncbi:unnamed protein product [Discosporangium mesarthrocarpum]
MNSLTESLEYFLKPEVLDGDNQYLCQNCERKVDAVKGLKLLRLPYLLSLQLKRFDFDYTTFQRIKLNDEVRFPMVLDMNQYVDHGSDPGGASGDGRNARSDFQRSLSMEKRKLQGLVPEDKEDGGRGRERETVMGHWGGGGSRGGSSSAHNTHDNTVVSGRVTPVTVAVGASEGGGALLSRVKTDAEDDSLGEGGLQGGRGEPGGGGYEGDLPGLEDFWWVSVSSWHPSLDSAGPGSMSVGTVCGGRAVATTTGGGDRMGWGSEAGEALLPEEVPMDAATLLTRSGPWVYELYAVLIHSGSALGGHYYAHIKSLDDGRWYTFNDSHVTPIRESAVKATWGGKWSLGAGGHRWGNSNANAYMLMYRKVDPEKNQHHPRLDEVPAHVRGQAEAENRQLWAKRAAAKARADTVASSVTIRLKLADQRSDTVVGHKNKPLSALIDQAAQVFGLQVWASAPEPPLLLGQPGSRVWVGDGSSNKKGGVVSPAEGGATSRGCTIKSGKEGSSRGEGMGQETQGEFNRNDIVGFSKAPATSVNPATTSPASGNATEAEDQGATLKGSQSSFNGGPDLGGEVEAASGAGARARGASSTQRVLEEEETAAAVVALAQPRPPMRLVRLREYLQSSGLPGRPMEDESKTLFELGVLGGRTLWLETRKPGEGWPHFDPKDPVVTVVRFTRAEKKADGETGAGARTGQGRGVESGPEGSGTTEIEGTDTATAVAEGGGGGEEGEGEGQSPGKKQRSEGKGPTAAGREEEAVAAGGKGVGSSSFPLWGEPAGSFMPECNTRVRQGSTVGQLRAQLAAFAGTEEGRTRVFSLTIDGGVVTDPYKVVCPCPPHLAFRSQPPHPSKHPIVDRPPPLPPLPGKSCQSQEGGSGGGQGGLEEVSGKGQLAVEEEEEDSVVSQGIGVRTGEEEEKEKSWLREEDRHVQLTNMSRLYVEEVPLGEEEEESPAVEVYANMANSSGEDSGGVYYKPHCAVILVINAVASWPCLVSFFVMRALLLLFPVVV